MGSHYPDPTQLLLRWQAGDEESRDVLFTLFYPFLKSGAARLLSCERQVSLSPADLVHEAVVRLVSSDSNGWIDRAHFRAIASKVMRQVIVDHVRAKSAQKRHHQKVTLVPELETIPQTDFCELHEHLARLAAVDSDKAAIVEMRYFGGMTIDEVAAVQGKSPATIKKHWAIARAWLIDALGS